MSERRTTAERIEHDLAIRILRGDIPANQHLPPLRELAREHGVTLPTIQRVVERLEALGLVTARHGSGVLVHDPARAASLALVPLWFEALADQPERVVRALADFLELRRVVAAHLVATRRPALLVAAGRLGALATAPEPSTVDARAEADLAFSRAVLEATDSFAGLAVFHTVERLVREVPHVAEALYGDAEGHRATLVAVVAAIASPSTDADVAVAFAAALAAWDAAAVDRFRAALHNS